MIIVLLGQSCSGKTTTAKKLEEEGYTRMITYTTRSPRVGEIDGVDYHFITQKEFLTMIDKDEFAEYAEYDASYGHVYYGSAKMDYDPDSNKVVVLNPEGYLQIKRNLIPHFSVYLNISVNEMERRIQKRGDSKEEFLRRIKTDTPKFDIIKDQMDLVITDGTPNEIVSKIMNAV